MKNAYDMILARAEENRPPEDIDLVASDDGPVVAIGWSRRNATYLPLSEGRRVTGDADAVQRGVILVEVLKDRRTGLKDDAMYRDVHDIKVITGMNVAHEDDHGETINAEYYAIGSDYINDTQHNHQHLVQDPDREHEYYAFGPF